MSIHVVVGAGPVGSATALLLAEAGEEVRLVSRRGRAPEHPGIEAVAADAGAPGVLDRHTAGAAVVYNCANPSAYQHWAAQWPPLAAAILGAAERSGAVLATVSNLYGYGRATGPLTEQTPLAPTGGKGRLRADMWLAAEAAHRAGRLRAVEVRSADYFGPRVEESAAGKMLVPRVLRNRPGIVLGRTDQPHSYTYVVDAARTLVRLAAEESAWGRPWHVPSHPPMTQREFAERLCAVTGARRPQLITVGRGVRRLAGLRNPRIREFEEVAHQVEGPFVLDSSACARRFGLLPTPLDEALHATAAWWRGTPTQPEKPLVSTGLEART
ncbi:NAD-dependent epimerase/dehydratase family protein [Dactylosporangium sp. NPDC049525]|uniref:NAD-dependent epimerase/dehydratase family protein n=1 Tax=Dactylosporangium sp. NPDC049525 TaxID=3154730 RepID=UPI003429D31F